MLIQSLTRGLVAAMVLVLFGGLGCSKKGVHATTETEYAQPASAGAVSETEGTAAAAGEQAEPRISEQELAGRSFPQFGEGASGPEAFTSSDLGLPGSSVGADGPPVADVTEPDQGAFPRIGPGTSDKGAQPEEGMVTPPGSDVGGTEADPVPLVSRRESGGGPQAGERVVGPPGSDSWGTTQDPVPLLSRSSSTTGPEPLVGFPKVEAGETPVEHRVEAETLIAKVEPSTTFESQVEVLRQEHMAAAREGLTDIFFPYDSWRLSDAAQEALQRDAAWLEANPSKRLVIEGHCDERGSSAYNLVLGEKRAKAVRRYLIDLGVSSLRVAVVSYGEERPFCEAQTETCYQLNRRGHFAVPSR